MKCPKCDNPKLNSYDRYHCPVCNGTGEIEQTNEEWFCNLTTEDKANRMTKFIMDIVCWNNDPKPSEVRDIVLRWLKEKHNGV